MKRKEVVEKRTENSKLYENQDHSFTREIFLEAVHYEDADGRWKEKEALECCLAGQGDDSALVSLSKDGCMLSWGVQGAAHAVGKKTEAGTLYPEIFGDVDMRCQTLGEKVKEDFILRSARAARSFTYLYHMKGLKAVQDGDYVAFLNEKGDEVFTVCAPYMQDAAGSRSDEIRLLFTQEDDAHCKISFEADEKWLDAPDRCFPVVLDPVTTTSKKAKDIMDAHVDSKHEEDNFQTNMFLKTMGGDNIQRSFVKFVLPEISTGDMVLNARLVLVSLTTDGKERTVNVHRVMQDWDSSTINWYNKPVYEETVQDSCRYTADKQKYITLDITRLVKDWYQNGKNFGLMFKDDYELSGYTSFLSSDCDSGYQDMRPRIDITYANYSGLEDFWNYHSQDAGRAGTVHVNDFNGNLILERTDFAMGGSLMPVSLKHVYNSNNRKENLGYGLGFRLNYHQTLKKVTIAGTDYYQHVDGDGTVHYFYYDSSKKTWKDEFGLEFTLTVNSGTAEPYVIRDKEDNLLVFDSNGYLIKVRDKNSNTLAITYSNSRIAKITDGAGRVTSFTYLKDANGTATDLSQITMPSGQTIAFAYTSHMLTSVTDMDGTVTKYTFASNGNLSSVVNADGYQLKYGYYGTAPYRVKSIAEYGGATAGNTLTLTYGYNSTKFTDSKGRSEIYRFDNSCNLLHIHDGFGHAASGKYTKDGKHVNRLENATKLQSNIVQLLKDPIIQAKTIGWTPKVYAEGTGTTSVNTDTKYCMVGNRSLKAECTSVSHDVTQNGTKSTVKNTYTYTKDRLTGISHNGFRYGFAYDAFGNLTGESAAGKQIIGYEYEAANGNLLKTTYANGDYVRFTYDGQDRVLLSYYKPASGSEQKLNEYVYDRSGNLAKVTNHMTGKSYEFDYDFLDRLMRARDNADNYYEYTYDVNNNMTRMYHGAGVYGIATTYSYDKDGREITASASKNYYRTTEYDPLGRIANQLWHTPAAISGVIYEYSGSGTRENGLPSSMQVGGSNYGYTYDQNGNITQYQVSDTNASGGTTKTVTYQYDELNRLIRENNQILNKTVTYAYDIGGNLVSEKEYAYASGTLPASASVTKTGTFDPVWKDKLVKWNGVAMTYDASGNMITKGSTRYTWTLGNALAAVSGGKNIQYSYDHAGHRIRKVVDGAVTQMRYAGDLLVSERTGSEKTLWYRYDSSGNVIALTYESEIYMYLRNAQNDIIGLLDKDGKVVVRYTYDSWGQVVKIEGTLKDKVGARNPFRYKGYYYDVETGLYYCRSRYYDPAIRRFISADDTQVLRDNLDMLGEKNLYAYCDDNPITRVDGDGQCWNIVVGAVIGAAMNVLAGGVAAAVTGQEYTVTDMIVAGFAGAVAGGLGSVKKLAVLKIVGAIGGGVISAVYAGLYSYKRGDSVLATVGNASTAFLTTVFISNLTGFADASEFCEKSIAIAWGATYGVGASSIAASVSLGVSNSVSQNEIQEKQVYWEKKIGQGRYFNGRTGTSVNYNIWKTSAGVLKKRAKKIYRPSNAYSV